MARTRSIEQWAALIRKDLKQAVSGIIQAGVHLKEAKLQLGHGNYGAMLSEAGIHERTAERLMKIASNPALTNPDNFLFLPTSMRTLSELATLPAPKLEGYIRDGVVTIDMERSDVDDLKLRAKGIAPGRSKKARSPGRAATPKQYTQAEIDELAARPLKPARRSVRAARKGECRGGGGQGRDGGAKRGRAEARRIRARGGGVSGAHRRVGGEGRRGRVGRGAAVGGAAG